MEAQPQLFYTGILWYAGYEAYAAALSICS